MIGPTLQISFKLIHSVCLSPLFNIRIHDQNPVTGFQQKKLEIQNFQSWWLTPIRAVVYVIQMCAFSVSKWHRERDISLVHT